MRSLHIRQTKLDKALADSFVPTRLFANKPTRREADLPKWVAGALWGIPGNHTVRAPAPRLFPGFNLRPQHAAADGGQLDLETLEGCLVGRGLGWRRECRVKVLGAWATVYVVENAPAGRATLARSRLSSHVAP